ncbi:MAG: glycosyl hydrolase family 32 [Verrucomicrobiae bacterium]
MKGFVPTKDPQFQLFESDLAPKVQAYEKRMVAGELLVLGKWNVAVGFDELIPEPDPVKSWPGNKGELLYNGIQLPETWPPRSVVSDDESPMPVPYLTHPPKIIPINLGRQLFVDDFLIENTNLEREYHRATKYEGNPVLRPETPLETGADGMAIATPKSGGVWWDPDKQDFRMWYDAEWVASMAYATSKDGLRWERPELDIEVGTNRVLPQTIEADSSTVFVDYATKDPGQRYKMFQRSPDNDFRPVARLMVSADGVHWSKPVMSGEMGDRSGIFYNPFRRKWVFSLRDYYRDRSRRYWEASDFLSGAQWKNGEPVLWIASDRLDKPDPEIQQKPQLYNLDAVAYESIMLGIFQIWFGPDNAVCEKTGLPKTTELQLMYSRDGFHWSRPDRHPFIRAERSDKWDRGYVQSVGGVCLVRGDKIWFYYTGFQGNPDRGKGKGKTGFGMYDRGSTGVAFLRRDGFASLNAGKEPGTLTTRPVTFSGNRLFVNADAEKGRLRAEILDENGQPISPFTKANCQPVTSDGTIQPVRWNGAEDLSSVAGRPVRIRFELENGKLYSFWVSADKTGRSDGYVAAGGPGFNGPTDTVGVGSLEAEKRFSTKQVRSTSHE